MQKQNVCYGVVATLVCLTGVIQAETWEFHGIGDIAFAQSDLWDQQPFGVEARLVCWIDPALGIALSAGGGQWKAERYQTVTEGERWRGWDGDVHYYPLGLSVLTRHAFAQYQENVSVCLEAGVRYLWCNTHVDLRDTIRWPQGEHSYEDITNAFEAECTESVIGRIGAGLEWTVSDNPARVFVAGGYQFDLDKGELSTEITEGKISEPVSLEGVFLQVGFAYPIP